MIPAKKCRAGALAIISLGLALAGCSASTAASTSSTTTTPLITTTTIHYVPTYVSVGGHKVLLPTEAHHEPITGYSAEGQNIIITTHGFEPSKLYASRTAPVVFTNLTDGTQEVVFYSFPTVANSGGIAPGGSYTLHYSASITLAYGNRSGSDVGHLYIGLCPPFCG
jgi:hypothetical protein